MKGGEGVSEGWMEWKAWLGFVTRHWLPRIEIPLHVFPPSARDLRQLCIGGYQTPPRLQPRPWVSPAARGSQPAPQGFLAPAHALGPRPRDSAS